MKIRLCGSDAVEEGAMIRIQVDGKPPFAVCKVKGDYFVIDDTCSHGKSSLAEDGDLHGHCVTCTWHDGKFDVRTGAALCAPCTHPINTYPVKIEDDAIWIETE